MKKKLFSSVNVCSMIACICLVACICLLVGCASSPASNVEISYGDKTDETTSLVINNSTEKDISTVTTVQTGKSAENTLTANPTDGVWNQNSEAMINLAPLSNQAGQTSEGTISLKGTYDIKFTFADQTSASIHEFVVQNVDKMKDVELCMGSDNIVYLRYKDSDGNEVSTYSNEKKLHEDEVAQAAALAAKAAQEQAALEAARAAAESTSNSSSQSSSSGSSQSSDGCVEGGVKLR